MNDNAPSQPEVDAAIIKVQREEITRLRGILRSFVKDILPAIQHARAELERLP